MCHFFLYLVNFLSLFTNLASSIFACRNDYRKSLPPFLWLLRDVLIDMPERNGKRMTSTEYLKAEVLHCDETKGTESTDAVEATGHKAITQFFLDFECKTLPPPSTKREVMANVSESQDKLDPVFNTGVDELVVFLKKNVKPKKVLQAPTAICNGATLALLVKEVAKAVNNPHSIPPLDNTWKLVVQSRCQTVQETLLEEYCTTIKTQYNKLSRGGPINECVDPDHENSASVMRIHNKLWSEMRKRLLDDVGPLLSSETTGNVTLESVTEELEKQLIQYREGTDPHTQVSVRKVVGGAIFPIVEENRRRSEEFCNKLFTDLYTPITERVTAGDDRYTSENLSADIKNLLQEYDARSIGPEKWHVRAKIVTTIKENKNVFEKHLKEVLKRAEIEREVKEKQDTLQSTLQSLNDSRRELNIVSVHLQAEKRKTQQLNETIEKLKRENKTLKQTERTLKQERLDNAPILATKTHTRKIAERMTQAEKTIEMLEKEIAKQTTKIQQQKKIIDEFTSDRKSKADQKDWEGLLPTQTNFINIKLCVTFINRRLDSPRKHQ